MKKQDSGNKDLLAIITDTVIGAPVVTAGLNIYERITTKKEEKAKKSIEEFVLGLRSLTQTEIQKIADDIDKNGESLLETLLDIVFSIDADKKVKLITICFKKYLDSTISQDTLLDAAISIENTRMLYLFILRGFNTNPDSIHPVVMENLISNGLIVRNIKYQNDSHVFIQGQQAENLKVTYKLSNVGELINQALEEL